MNIKKVASVCKRMGRVKAVQVGGTLYAGPAAALYAMPADLPKIRTADEMMAVLGYTLKEREKIMATLEHYDTAEAMMEARGWPRRMCGFKPSCADGGRSSRLRQLLPQAAWQRHELLCSHERV